MYSRLLSSILLLALLSFHGRPKAQSIYPGFISGNYAGASGMIHQPASIAENAYPYDVVLLGVNAFVDNNYAKVTRNRAFMNFSFADVNADFIKSQETKYAFANIELTGPSIMLRLKNSRGIGFTSRVRTYVNADGLSGDLATIIADEFNNAQIFDQSFSNQQYFLRINSWQEYGITYAQVIQETPFRKIKAGVTAKLLVENGGAQMDFVTGTFQNIGDRLIVIPQFSLEYGYSEQVQNIANGGFSFFGGKKGFGLDLGLIYEFYETKKGPTPSSTKIINNYRKQTNKVPKYKQKLGFALLDVGRLKYTYGPNSGEASLVVNTSGVVDLSSLRGTYDDPDVLGDSLNQQVDLNRVDGTYSMGLPTAFQANHDYRIRENVYINTNAYINLSFLKWSDYTVHDISNVTITPRWENNWLGFYLPMYVNLEGQFNMGLASHIGPLVIGVHDFLPFISRKESTSAGAYVMLKTFVPNKKKKKSKIKCGPQGWERARRDKKKN